MEEDVSLWRTKETSSQKCIFFVFLTRQINHKNMCELSLAKLEKRISKKTKATLFLSSRTRNNDIQDHARFYSEIEYRGMKRALPHNQYHFPKSTYLSKWNV